MKSSTVLLISAVLMLAIDGHAEIGQIGSPLVGCFPNVACGIKRSTRLSEPYFVATILFDGNEATYKQQLAELIAQHEHSYRGSLYEIVSTVPDVETVDPAYVANLNRKWEANVDEIIQTLQSAHVPKTRIYGRKDVSAEASVNMITVFVYLSIVE